MNSTAPWQHSGIVSLYTIHYSPVAPPLVEQKANGVVLNFILTIPEAIFVEFVKNSIQTALDKKDDLVSLDMSEQMQNDFNAWVTKNFTNTEFSSEELNLNKLVASVWEKTKVLTENFLNASKNQAAIEDEKQWQAMADSMNMGEEFLLQGWVGKVFTVRQANFLLKSAAGGVRC